MLVGRSTDSATQSLTRQTDHKQILYPFVSQVCVHVVLSASKYEIFLLKSFLPIRTLIFDRWAYGDTQMLRLL